MRVIPHMMVITPCDWWETYKATMAVYDIKGPSYVRFGRNPAPSSPIRIRLLTSIRRPSSGMGVM